MLRYGKRDDMIVYEHEPFNAETAMASLLERPVTATEAFYVRSHGAVPEPYHDDWRLRVDGAVERKLSLSLETLQEAFRERHITATLQCAGNRRAGLIALGTGRDRYRHLERGCARRCAGARRTNRRGRARRLRRRRHVR
jgi:hypothetical protein